MRLAFRLAWRAARRERLATFLTALLVALPVVALVAAGVLARSAQIPDQVQQERRVGQSLLNATAVPAGNSETLTVAPPTELLPPGSRVVNDITRSSDALIAPNGSLQGSVTPYELDYSDPLAHGIIDQRAGRAPRNADEVAVTTFLAQHFHLRLGDTLVLTTLGMRRIVGIVVDPNYLQAREIYSVPGAFAARPAVFARYLIALPPGADPAKLVLPPAYDLEIPGSSPGSRLPDADTINAGALVIVLALLEASLTAGTAFAVGARRRRRDLALIAVNGGRAVHTGGVVLANGLVCGVVGVIVGLAGGVTAARLGFPRLQDHSSQLLPGLRIDPLLLVAAGLFGLVAALLSAGFPAILAAKGSLRNALGKARGSSGTPGWITVTGVGAVALGIAVVSAAVRDASRGNGGQTTTALLGIVFVELGGVAVCPALLGLAGRFGSKLPALPRLALRDVARQRARSGPAVAAIAAAVSGSMALSVYLASDHLAQVRDYRPPLPRNVVTISLDSHSSPALPALRQLIGAAAAAQATSSHDFVDRRGEILYSLYPDSGSAGDQVGGDVVVAQPALLRLLGASPAAVAAFANGSAVVGTGGPLPPTLSFAQPGGPNPGHTASVPTIAAGWPDDQGRPQVLIGEDTAARLLSTLPTTGDDPSAGVPQQAEPRLWAPLPAGLSDAKRRNLIQQAGDINVFLTIDAGLGDSDALAALALLGVAGAFSLIVTAAATVLAAAESQSDLSILGAVGASPLARRMFTAAQGGVTALLGGALGIVIGLVPGITVVHSRLNHLPLTVPWQPFAAFLIGLPALAAIGGLVFSRSRLPGVARTL